LDDAVVARIDALKAKCDALTAELSWLKAANAAVAPRAVGASPSAGRKRARVEDPTSLEEELMTTTTRLLALQDAARGLEEREAAREPLLERLAADARDVFVGNVLPRLDDGDLAVLATVNRKMRDVVFDSPVGDVRDVAAVRRELARVPNFVGSISRLAWAKERGCPWYEKTFTCIARGGNVDVAKWAKERGCPWVEVADAHVVLDTAEGDHLEVCASAAAGGHLEMLQWARANGAPWGEKTFADAAFGGHMEVLRWLRANDCPWDEETCRDAAEGGHLAVLQWARANGAPWNEGTCHSAALGGHLEVLQWARANGAPWDEDTCAYAALRGHLEVLQWARANGCPWNPELCESLARMRGHKDVLQWIVAAEVGEGA
jgi:hypothetical protein